MNRLNMAKRTAVVAALVEGNSVRATARMTSVSKPTILKLLAQLGDVCAQYHNATIRNLKTKRVECDEIWQFCYANLVGKLKPESTSTGRVSWTDWATSCR